VFYVVDKTNLQLGIFKPSEEFLQRGEEKVDRAIQVYKKFFGEKPEYDINEYYVEAIL
jgi:hypothetical protein